jgi:hypothetical protein
MGYLPRSITEFVTNLTLGNQTLPEVAMKTSTGVASQGPGTIQDFAPVLTEIIKRSGRATTAPDRNWSVCIEPLVVKAQSWKNPPAATIKSLQESVSRFLSLHDKGAVKFKITERPGTVFLVEEYVGGCAEIGY